VQDITTQTGPVADRRGSGRVQQAGDRSAPR